MKQLKVYFNIVLLFLTILHNFAHDNGFSRLQFEFHGAIRQQRKKAGFVTELQKVQNLKHLQVACTSCPKMFYFGWTVFNEVWAYPQVL